MEVVPPGSERGATRKALRHCDGTDGCREAILGIAPEDQLGDRPRPCELPSTPFCNRMILA